MSNTNHSHRTEKDANSREAMMDTHTTCHQKIPANSNFHVSDFVERLRAAADGTQQTLLMMFVAALSILTVLLRRFLAHRTKIRPKTTTAVPSNNTTISADEAVVALAEALERKRDFLSRVSDAKYGYRESEYGYIDDWRPIEFPHLQYPLAYEREGETDGGETEFEPEVYLDYAGSALPMKSQLEQNCRNNLKILANPHSTGPAASRTLLKVKQAKTLVLKHFNATPGKFASLKLPDSFYKNDKNAEYDNDSKLSYASVAMDCHAGYEVVFTSGATEGFKIIAERFPWRSAAGRAADSSMCTDCHRPRPQKRQSILLYTTNSHNSVVGMRQLAKRHGAIFHCIDTSDLESMTVKDFAELEEQLLPQGENDIGSQSGHCACKPASDNDKRHLLVFPSECNFGGDCPDAPSIVALARECGWYTMLDIAKAASTGPVDLRELDADFAAVSFYKLFGEPTGLGALFVKRSSIPVLFESDSKSHPHYQGGGSVNIMVPKLDYTVPKNESASALLDSLTNGSIHFRGITNLAVGFDTLQRLGGMDNIQKHTSCLARELVRRLRDLKHGNGLRAIQIYGAWSDENYHALDVRNAEAKRGPTVAFNVIRNDGSIVGYNEVSKLAALYHPPIQSRTGCFCNPGACQRALGLSDQEVIDNFEKTGHVCGDHIDIVNGLATGAIRISFGKESIWEDLDTVVKFLEATFVNRCDVTDYASTGAEKHRMQVNISAIYVFPIKSCAAQRVSKWQIEMSSGKLRYDREFALVDTSGTALRLQTCPRLGLISPVVDPVAMTMIVSAPGYSDLIVNLSDDLYHGGDNVVQVCGNKCGGRVWGDADVSEWFSSFLGIQCWLARYTTDGNFNTNQELSRVGFSNEQPLLLVSENAVTKLNGVLEEQGQRPVDSKRFRPNLVVKRSGSSEQEHTNMSLHIEDDWKSLALAGKDFRFKVEGACPRCTMVDFDPATGQKGKTLRALAKYRRKHSSINFGIFLRAIRSTNVQKREEVWIEEGNVLDCS